MTATAATAAAAAGGPDRPVRVDGGGAEGGPRLHRGVHGAQQGAGDGAQAAQEVSHRDGGAGRVTYMDWMRELSVTVPESF